MSFMFKTLGLTFLEILSGLFGTYYIGLTKQSLHKWGGLYNLTNHAFGHRSSEPVGKSMRLVAPKNHFKQKFYTSQMDFERFQKSHHQMQWSFIRDMFELNPSFCPDIAIDLSTANPSTIAHDETQKLPGWTSEGPITCGFVLGMI